ncbi:MAG: MBL fold metallo-hydrolase [Betaproteobacteria bacterium]|nr:MBL fold metallo-hydrolase [Betaproteobacteria bacterium]
MLNRRGFLAGVTAVAAGACSGWQKLAYAQGAGSRKTRLILLGTKGGPRVGGDGRKNPSTLLLINGVPYVVDCGYGTSQHLVRAGVPLNSLRYVFLTHHHSDHNLEFGSVIYNGWATGLRSRVDAWGPPGTERMAQAFFDYMKLDIETRMDDEGRPDLRKLVFAHDFDQPGVVMQNDDVKVSAARVRHPPIEHAYAYRFDTTERSMVISGDTNYSLELIELAKGADVLVHEVLYMPGLEKLLSRVPNAAKLRDHIVASHTVPEDVGRVAAAAGVKTVVLSHFVPGDDPSITDEQWTAGVRKHFNGQIVVGKDLMEI